MITQQRVLVLVDVQNMFYGVRAAFNGKLNYEKLLDVAVGDRQLVRAIAYVVQRPDVDQSGFCNLLTNLGYEVKTKETRNRLDNSGRMIPTKGSYEVELTIDAMLISNKVDTVVLVTGDGSYSPLVSVLRQQVGVEVIGVDGSTAHEMIDLSSKFTSIVESWTIPFNNRHDDYDDDDEEYEDDEEDVQPASYASALGVQKRRR